MRASLRALLTGVIEYAGMFPPVSLPLDESIRNYLRYCTDSDSWMLGRFICPVARLAEVEPFLTEVNPGTLLPIAALGTAGKTRQEWLDNLRRDQRAIRAFRHQHPGRVTVDVLEMKLPGDFPTDAPGVAEALAAGVLAEPDSAADPTFFFEPSFALPSKEMAALIVALAPHRHRVGLKLRCGGAEPAAYPTPADVASIIEQCHRGRLPLKFTAGLHHPIRHFNKAANVTMHGFINVFCAALFTWSYDLSRESAKRGIIETIVADEDPTHFVFADDSIRWQDHHLTAKPDVLAATVGMFRRQVVSFGSCSFDEPRDDLRKLGWLN
ncbi:hypothetical protein AYO44_01980 [Planctomycetaceae bacterium SCGC AG-212-F19]|nr:hypothetical protein AYO44_01980 [Planctomycetaceae bacterium SCGC AG-212-F19]